MNLEENIREGLRSIRANRLRAILTALIIALGIMALVGILTAIDGMQSSVDNSFAGLGANSFDIRVEQFRGRRRGIAEKLYKPLSWLEAKQYKTLFRQKRQATVSLYISVSQIAELKYASKKTNPNTEIKGIDENYLVMKGYKIASGRNFSPQEVGFANRLVLLGGDVARDLFGKEKALGKEISVLGQKCQVVGILEKKGSLTGGGDDRVALLPIETARQIASPGQALTFDITTSVADVSDINYIIGEATATMRQLRKDPLGEENSFVIERSDALAKNFESITGYLRIGAFGISFITLLGASIALMNIMMVSVTERTREIGVRKALGASPYKIRLQFLIEAIIICVLGGVAGIGLGIGVGNVVSKIISEGSSFIVPWGWIILGLVVCIIVGIASGIYPAIKASRLDPIEALRYE